MAQVRERITERQAAYTRSPRLPWGSGANRHLGAIGVRRDQGVDRTHRSRRMTPHTPLSYWRSHDRHEHINMTLVFLGVISIVGIYLTLFSFHSSTHAQIAASNCKSISCEAPLVKFVVGQVVTAEASGNQALLGSNCALLASLQESTPNKITSNALSQYCTTSVVRLPTNTSVSSSH